MNAPSPWMLKAESVEPVKVQRAFAPLGKVTDESPVGLATWSRRSWKHVGAPLAERFCMSCGRVQFAPP